MTIFRRPHYKVRHLQVSFEIFNAGSNKNNYRKKDIVNTISKFLPMRNIFFKSKGFDRRNYKVNFTKVQKKLNFKPTYTLEMGVQEIIEYFNKTE